MTTTTSPRVISRSMSCSTCSWPNHLLTPDSRTRGSPFELVTRSTLGGTHILRPVIPSRRRNGSTRAAEFPAEQRFGNGCRLGGATVRRTLAVVIGTELEASAHLPRAHVRLPDERARLR